MKKIILTLFVCTLCYFCIAQPPKKGERIEALKAYYITNHLNLSGDEAQKFWPVYNNYSDEIKQARQTNKTDELKFEEDALNIRKKYKAEFKKVLGDDARVNKVYTIEKDFAALLQKELKNRIQKRQQERQQQ